MSGNQFTVKPIELNRLRQNADGTIAILDRFTVELSKLAWGLDHTEPYMSEINHVKKLMSDIAKVPSVYTRIYYERKGDVGESQKKLMLYFCERLEQFRNSDSYKTIQEFDSDAFVSKLNALQTKGSEPIRQAVKMAESMKACKNLFFTIAQIYYERKGDVGSSQRKLMMHLCDQYLPLSKFCWNVTYAKEPKAKALMSNIQDQTAIGLFSNQIHKHFDPYGPEGLIYCDPEIRETAQSFSSKPSFSVTVKKNSLVLYGEPGKSYVIYDCSGKQLRRFKHFKESAQITLQGDRAELPFSKGNAKDMVYVAEVAGNYFKKYKDPQIVLINK